MSQGGDFQGGEYCQGTLTRLGLFDASVGILTGKVIALGMAKNGIFWGVGTTNQHHRCTFAELTCSVLYLKDNDVTLQRSLNCSVSQ